MTDKLPRKLSALLNDVKNACLTEHDAAVLWDRTRELILAAVPGDLGALIITDPISGLIVDGYGYGDPNLSRTYMSRYYLKREMYSYLDQRADGMLISQVSRYTGGRPEKDPLYRDWLCREGFKHGVRVAFVAGDYYWGGLCIIRGNDTPDFSKEELTFLHALVGPVGAALRTAAAWKEAHAAPPVQGTLPEAGVIFVDHRQRVLFRTETAQNILNDITNPHPARLSGSEGTSLPPPALAVCARLHTRNGNDGAIDCSVTVKGHSQWWTLTATAPEPGMPHGAETVLIMSRARPLDTAPVLLATYNLTQRERELVQLVRLGLSTAAIAKRLFLSCYTVQDHLKNIFTKVGVKTRGELMAVIFREQSPAGRKVARDESDAGSG